MSLDKRLNKELAIDFAFENMSNREWQEWRDEVIPAIKQAFIDEGWIQSPRNTHQPRTVNVEQVGEKLYVVSGMDEVTTYDGKKISLDPAQPERMTGPEWLERFEKEIGDDLLGHDLGRAVEAARRASGVDDE